MDGSVEHAPRRIRAAGGLSLVRQVAAPQKNRPLQPVVRQGSLEQSADSVLRAVPPQFERQREEEDDHRRVPGDCRVPSCEKSKVDALLERRPRGGSGGGRTCGRARRRRDESCAGP